MIFCYHGYIITIPPSHETLQLGRSGYYGCNFMTIIITKLSKMLWINVLPQSVLFRLFFEQFIVTRDEDCDATICQFFISCMLPSCRYHHRRISNFFSPWYHLYSHALGQGPCVSTPLLFVGAPSSHDQAKPLQGWPSCCKPNNHTHGEFMPHITRMIPDIAMLVM